MVDIIVLKVLFAICIFAVDFIGGCVPIFGTKYFVNYGFILDYFNAFGGGTLFGVSVLQMLSVSQMKPSIATDNMNTGFPLVHFIACSGFFFTFFIQWWIKTMRDRDAKRIRANSMFPEDDSDFRERSGTLEMMVISEDAPVASPISPTSFILLFVLILESILTGITLGIQEDSRNIYIMFFAIISHDWIESMVLTLSFFEALQDMSSKKRLIAITFFFSISTSVGIVMGLFVEHFISLYNIQMAASVFMAFASGTFFYISTIDMLSKSIQSTKLSFKCFLLALIGFGTSSLLLYFIR